MSSTVVDSKESFEKSIMQPNPETSSDCKPKASDTIYLKPKMTLLNGVTVIVGSIIGAGIFVSPQGVATGTNSVGLSLVVWAASGIFSLVGAYCYAELGCMIVKTGGDYIYILEAFGPFVAFLRMWAECMIVRPITQAIIALTFSFYALRNTFPDCDPPNMAIRILAFLCIALLTFINCWDVKLALRVQDLSTYAKVLALVIIIGTGIVQLALGNFEYINFDNSETDVGKIALALYAGLFAYNAWNYLNFLIEELQEPQKNLPIAIFISCILITVIYTLTIVAYHTTLSIDDVKSSEAVAITFAHYLYGNFWWIIPIFVSLSTFGGVNGILLSTSRLFYAAAQQGHMPQIFSMVQVNRLTPAPAVIIVSLMSVIYLCLSDINTLINYFGFANWFLIGLAVTCLPYFRWKRPDLIRPIKVNLFFPLIYILASIFITITPIIAAPIDAAYGFCFIATGIPIYFFFVYWEKKPQCIQNAIKSFTHKLQKLLLVVPSEKTKIS